MASYAQGGAEKTITSLLGRVSSTYAAGVRAALLGFDDELVQLLAQLPQSPVCFPVLKTKLSH